MPDQPDRPQICLATPPAFELMGLAERLAACLDAVPVACVRLAMAGRDEDAIGRAADSLRALTHDRDIPLVIDTHLRLVQRHGLDGVHLLDGARGVKAARKELGTDAIIGAECGTSRHDGMTAGELGADYVLFGPVAAGALGDGRLAEAELFEWWSQMIEVPCIASGGLTPDRARALAPMTDFIELGAELWDAEDPVARLRTFEAALG